MIEIFDSKNNEILDDLKTKLSYVVKELEDSPLVIFNLFSTSNFGVTFNSNNDFCFSINEYLKHIAPDNFILINTDNIFVKKYHLMIL